MPISIATKKDGKRRIFLSVEQRGGRSARQRGLLADLKADMATDIISAAGQPGLQSRAVVSSLLHQRALGTDDHGLFRIAALAGQKQDADQIGAHGARRSGKQLLRQRLQKGAVFLRGTALQLLAAGPGIQNRRIKMSEFSQRFPCSGFDQALIRGGKVSVKRILVN